MKFRKPRFNLVVKFLVFFLIITIVPVVTLGYVSFTTARDVVRTEVNDYNEALLVERESYLELLLQSMVALVSNISNIEEIRQALAHETVIDDAYTRLATSSQIGYLLNNYVNLDGLVAIDIITPQGNQYHVGESLLYDAIDQSVYERIYEAAASSDKRIAWIGVEDNINAGSQNKKVLTAAHLLTVIDPETFQEKPVGLLIVSYSLEALAQQFAPLDLGEGGYMLIVDSRNRILYHSSEPNQVGMSLSDSFAAQLSHESGSLDIAAADGVRLVNYTTSDLSGWVLLSSVPVASLTASANRLGIITGVIILISMLVVASAALIVSQTMVTPLNRLTNALKLIQQGSMVKLRLNDQRHDEIGELLRWFNVFVDSQEARRKAEQEVIAAKEATDRLNEELAAHSTKLEAINAQLAQEVKTRQAAEYEAIEARLDTEWLNTELEQQRDALANEIKEREHAQEEQQRLQYALIEAQHNLIRELSTPIIPITDDIIILPLIGTVSAERAKDITRALLAGITQYQAKTVILDITGVQTVDIATADHLSKTLQTARLKGAHTIISGVSDQVAETIVDLGIDWGKTRIASSLQMALAQALRHTNRRDRSKAVKQRTQANPPVQMSKISALAAQPANGNGQSHLLNEHGHGSGRN